MVIKDAANFMLTQPPIPELADEKVATIVYQFRSELLSRKEALTLLISKHRSFLESFIDANLTLWSLK